MSNADLVLTNAKVVTVDRVIPMAQAVAISDGKIVYVGDDNAVGEFVAASTKVIDLDGRLVVPGFHDSHGHLFEFGLSRLKLNLEAAQSEDEAVKIVADKASKIEGFLH